MQTPYPQPSRKRADREGSQNHFAIFFNASPKRAISASVL